jgi:hypothetical protein
MRLFGRPKERFFGNGEWPMAVGVENPGYAISVEGV